MQSPVWLQGGPFLDVSFILELKEEKTKAIQAIFTKLSTMPYTIEFVDDNLDELIL